MDNIYDNVSFNDETIEGEDFYMSKNGYRIMTAKFLQKKGYCCGNGCKHCPYHPKAQKGNRTLR